MQLDGWELILFYVLGGWTVAAGVLVVAARSPVHSALALVSALLAVAGLFVLLRAEFLAGVQVLVYVGGVMVLFLFVIMLVNVGREAAEARAPVFTRHAAAAGACVLALAALFAVAATRAAPLFAPLPPRAQAAREAAADRAGSRVSRNTEEVGADLYERAALPFEVASVLLLVAIVGSVLLARGRKQEKIFD